MAVRDGNGWVRCRQGQRHWGRFGAAGLLCYVLDGPVLLQQRSWWSTHGGTWGLPGGARDSHESAVSAALREAYEECGVRADLVTVRGIVDDDHGGWSYQTVLAQAAAPFAVQADYDETEDVAWVDRDLVTGYNLHPGLAAHWQLLRGLLQPLTVIVDGANVVGSRPDGWWRDRAGAAVRLRDELTPLASRGLTLPDDEQDGKMRWLPEIVLVVEGAARPAAGAPDAAGAVRMVSAAGSGDDTIAALARDRAGRRLVVTADRELRARCTAAGADVAGPGWLLGLLERWER
jgi:8-oxo-dGTP diphosphatase